MRSKMRIMSYKSRRSRRSRMIIMNYKSRRSRRSMRSIEREG